jgi:putative oxidoreductase
MSETSFGENLEDAGKLLLRLTLGVLLLFHGWDKVNNGVADIVVTLGESGFPGVMAYGVYLAEIVAPLLILVGVWTRPAGLLYAGSVLFASLLVHAVDFTQLAKSGGYGGELYIFYVAGGIAVAMLGAGKYSLRGGRSAWD